MKKFFCILVMLLALMGCTKNEAVIQEPESPPVQEVAETPEAVEPEPEVPVEPEPEPEPEPAESDLPDLPYPVYCWNDTAVASDGTVILQVPDHTLEVCYDAVSGKARGILALYQEGFTALYTGFYDLDGQPVLTDPAPIEMGCAGDLMWYGGFRNYTVQRISDGEILAEGVKNVTVMDDQVVLLPAYKFEALILLDSKTGETTLEADRGFRPALSFSPNGVRTYMAVTTPDGGKQNLIDRTGTPLLEEFQYEIYDVQQNCAIVRAYENGRYIRQAISLDTQEVVFQTEHNVIFKLLPESVLLEVEDSYTLVDYQGVPLYDTALLHYNIYDWDRDETPEYLLATILRNDHYCTVVLKPDGTEIAELPAEQWQDVEPLSPTTLIYAAYTGEGAFHQELYFRNLETGEDTVLTSGTSLWYEQIETSGGHMIRCEADGRTLLFLNDGTPAWEYPDYCFYIGGDVFTSDEGLRCLDGSWLYRAE